MDIKMKMSVNGLTLVKGEEGYESRPYNDQAQNATIAYGHLLHKGPVNQQDWAKYGSGISQLQADGWLMADLAWAEDEVNRVVTFQLNQNQFDAMVDFTFNEGSGTLEKSSVLVNINAENLQEAMHILLEYDYAGGKPSAGLLARRKKEVALFNTPVAD